MSEQVTVTVAQTIGELSGLPEGTRIATNHNRIMERDDAWGRQFWIEPGSVGPFFEPLVEWLPAIILPPVAEEKSEKDRSIRGLIDAGLLSIGDTLVSVRQGVTATATVWEGGTLVVKGQSYKTPSRAAQAALGKGTAVNGWIFWALKGGATLAELRGNLA